MENVEAPVSLGEESQDGCVRETCAWEEVGVLCKQGLKIMFNTLLIKKKRVALLHGLRICAEIPNLCKR